ncbi:OsmC family protein [Hymenobacter jejuensis]|uniref:OsmC family protein n=1 Tax=Hymenobacter jejuensis TaxID=2502781 RepID=A0A5B7ZYE3_9BACT|nr:OsmC family protein [Hymenobacter jejuensis]QDA59525.1 OsmC family protein [Hymenobacter jejuensis]
MPTITAHSGAEHFRTEISSDSGHQLLADEPTDNGGQNAGMAPAELLASSLGACTCITVRMYAARKQWPLRGIDTTVSFERNAQHVVTHLTRHLRLDGDLSEEQRQRLLQVANACPVHKALTASVAIDTELV